MDVVLVLHSHLPYVLHHGRWPHGSDWLAEAAIDSYLPLLEVLLRLENEDIPAPLTLGFTPVLANQLADPGFPALLESYFDHRLQAAAEAPRTLAATGDQQLAGIAVFWARRLTRLRALFRSVHGNLVGAFARLARDGRIELSGSAATHGLLPLLHRRESVDLQLRLGFSEHQRLFGLRARGCWVPECAYRPGIETRVSRAGFEYFWSDAHVAAAGDPADVYAAGETRTTVPRPPTRPREHSPYHAYRVGPATALLRDPVTSRQVWSRYEGYPGDEHYLEFHKIRWPEGLRLWRVSSPGSDLGQKLPYRPESARSRARHHARHFASLLQDTARQRGKPGGGIVAPFDTELFGHWWFEGPEFLGALFEVLGRTRNVRPATAARHLDQNPAAEAIELSEGSWGANGDFSMWQNPATEWIWERMAALDEAFWRVARPALAEPRSHYVLAQAARELLLAQSSDWPFIITTGAAADYAERRFREHCDAAEGLVAGLAAPEFIGPASRLAEQLGGRDGLFPDILPAVAAALG